MKFRAFLIGYAPPGWLDASGHLADRDKARRLVQESDFTAVACNGIQMGERIQTDTLSAGTNGVAPRSGAVLVCVGHEHGGKVAILSDEAENAA